ncbi:Trm112 family protein [Motilibacter deserti]|uniref:UPF0434 protein G9H71_04770 n=1 Tax=Motilibacter deserti TaxID=2714956 RepID=A0ABX0GRI7_9ACTN|nr:Trm112 family protein [Motilibacter deserti]
MTAGPDAAGAEALGLDGWLLEVLACPQDRSPLRVDAERSELVCTGASCGLAFPVRDGIPVLLLDEARPAGGPGGATDTIGTDGPAPGPDPA